MNKMKRKELSKDFIHLAACPFTLCRRFFTPKIGPVPPKL
jgi:hypothetical protein